MEAFRPNYHFTPQKHWMNDPNGLVFFGGEYHLFYQHHPENALPGPMHWGHAVSTDLVSWEHLPIALYPDEHGVIFSGSAVVDWEDSTGFFGGKPGLVAIFTHHDRVPGTDTVRERQSLAYSLDSGRSWIKYEGNPVLAGGRFVDFRDPKVFWHPDTKRWVMILATGQTVCLYHSPNLKEWTFGSEFGQDQGLHSGVWECPDLFPLSVDGDPARTKWVMLVSVGSAGLPEGSCTQYFIGEFDGITFVNDNPPGTVLRLDYGRDNYAGVSWSDIPQADGRRIYLGWMSNGRYTTVTPTAEEGWRSSMTVPRTLALETRAGRIRLIQRPVRELERLRTPVLYLGNVPVTEAAQSLAELALDSFELIVETASLPAADFAVKVRVSASRQTVIGYNAERHEVYVDRTQSGLSGFHEDFAGVHRVKLAEDSGPVRLQILVDRSSVEVFAGDGAAVITDLIYPEPEASGLALTVSGEELLLRRLALYKLEYTE
ncbi:glycoside hydrolase family 32 protein [Paenibacillus sp. FSL K6-1096]|uniref:glycoside hydrolase family 32 protein n=1 Tax=Paenibacillus sp. FSL K6-1096 TaxID=2921460 RepID=UPI0030EB42BD